ncbi:unnamed protein product [Echinostoma caproni]|uniref:Small ribosomal subunit protein mS31 n=1 Tax=Echinostoma caproni TaxID=27848 RepID=A0A183AZ93_9TREM|nr:unnamed protein product [Echinostoma caproni]
MYKMLAPGRLVIKTSPFRLGRLLSKKSNYENSKTKNGGRDEETKPLGINRTSFPSGLNRADSKLVSDSENAPYWLHEAYFDSTNLDWETETNVPFHEHMFLDEHVDKALRKSPPVAAFLDLVCVGLAQNPHFTVEQKREHLRWYAEYFKDKLDSIDASVREELRLTELERKARAIGTPAQK